jgi:four helix bundle protein
LTLAKIQKTEIRSQNYKEVKSVEFVALVLLVNKMAKVKRFEELECWKEARIFVQLIYGLTKKDPFRKDFELVGQIKRSAISSMANIAEGFHRNSSKEFMRFLDYSRSSIAETLSHSYIALDQTYISQAEIEKVSQQAEIVWK